MDVEVKWRHHPAGDRSTTTVVGDWRSTFLNLEEETGMVNVVCSPGLWTRYAAIARNAAALTIRGTIENRQNVVNLVADRVENLDIAVVAHDSRDFR